MRKQYKNKKRSCAVCKPFKMGWQNRWKDKEREKQELDEEEMLLAQYGVEEK